MYLQCLARFILLLIFLAYPSLSYSAPFKVTLLLEEPTGDNGWNDSLVDGLNTAKRDFSVQTDIVIANNSSAQLQAFELAASGSNLVIVASPAFHSLLRSCAGDYPNTLFGCIDVAAPARNIMSYIFSDAEVAYLAGVSAGILYTSQNISESSGIAWICAKDDAVAQNMRNAFVMGAQSVLSDIYVSVSVLGENADSEDGYNEAKKLYASGIHIIAHSVGAFSQGCLRAAREAGKFTFGIGKNQDSLAPGNIILSMIKRADSAVYDLVKAAVTGAFEGKKVVTLDLKNGGVDISDMTPFKTAMGKRFPSQLERRLKEVRRELENGTIEVTTRKKGQLCDCL